MSDGPSQGPLDGGCLCGAVRYRAQGPVARVNHCHCSQCRRSTGAIAATWVTVPVARFAVTKGKPAEYRASDFATRTFCASCGSTLFWLRDGAARIDVSVGTLDAPGNLAAGRHDAAEMRLAGFSLDPHLPEFFGDS